MSRPVRSTSVSIFVISIVLAVVVVAWPFASSGGPRSAPDLPEPTGYTAVQQFISPDENGVMRPWAYCIRYQSSNGNWRTETMDIKDGRLVPRRDGTIISSSDRKAVLRAGKKAGAFLGSPLESLAVDEEWIRNENPAFIGTDEILGYEALVVQNPEQGVKGWIVPRFGRVPLRIEADLFTLETIQITPGEPSPKLFSLDNVEQVDTEGFEILLRTLPERVRGRYSDQLNRFLFADEHRRLRR